MCSRTRNHCYCYNSACFRTRNDLRAGSIVEGLHIQNMLSVLLEVQCPPRGFEAATVAIPASPKADVTVVASETNFIVMIRESWIFSCYWAESLRLAFIQQHVLHLFRSLNILGEVLDAVAPGNLMARSIHYFSSRQKVKGLVWQSWVINDSGILLVIIHSRHVSKNPLPSRLARVSSCNLRVNYIVSTTPSEKEVVQTRYVRTGRRKPTGVYRNFVPCPFGAWSDCCRSRLRVPLWLWWTIGYGSNCRLTTLHSCPSVFTCIHLFLGY
jgi:hypothetical protein